MQGNSASSRSRPRRRAVAGSGDATALECRHTTADALGAARPLIGRWQRTSDSQPGRGTVERVGSNNIVEANSAVGNSNGIVVFPLAANNSIRQNLAVGNPPIQQSTSVPTGGGVDIWDQSPPNNNNNTFVGNMCLTAVNASCPTAGSAVPRKPSS
jgi:parallel beta-helix repeat protein